MRSLTATANAHRAAQGFSLVEMMVAMAAGLIVSGAVGTFLFSSMKSNTGYVQATRLTQELRNSLDLVVRDLRRAGYDDNALRYVGSTNASPFVPISIVGAGTSTSCIIYAYDRTYPNGTVTAAGSAGVLDVSNGEVRGLRLSTDAISGKKVIEYAESFGTTKPTCNGAVADYSTYPPACNATSGWCALSDPAVLNITEFKITDASADVGTELKLRKFDISLQGQLASSTEYTRAVQSSVKVRADCVRATLSDCLASP